MITPLPSPPLRSDGPATFADRGDAFMAALPVFVTQANALEANVNAKEASAVASADTATTKASEALASAQAAAANSAAPKWVSGTTYAIGDVRWSPANYLAYRRKTAGAGTADPSLDATNWVQLVTLPVQTGAAGKVLRSDGVNATWGGTSLFRSERTSNTALANIDTGTLIDITSGTFTQTFAACATLGSGWFCYLKNSGTGDVTLDPNASETIDGLASFVMYPGECRMVQCNGLALRSVVLNSFYMTFTASGTFTKPPGYTAFSGLLWGGGGGGGRCSASTHNATGGGGGACVPFTVPAQSLAGTEVIAIASGGLGATTTGSAQAGGDSSLGSLIVGYGGGGGYALTSGTYYGGGGGGCLSKGGTSNGGSVADCSGGLPNQGPSGGTHPTSGGSGFGGGAGFDGGGITLSGVYLPCSKDAAYGGGGGAYQSGANNYGGKSMFGGGGGGAAIAGETSSGGTSVWGGNGGSGSVSATPGDGTAPAGGGGGSNSIATRGGNGARGELRIWGII